MHFSTPTKFLLFTATVLSFLLNGAQAICSNYPPEKSTYSYINVNNPEKSTVISFDVVDQPTGSGHYVAQTSGVYRDGPNNEKNLLNAFDGNDNTGYTVQNFNYNSCTNGLCSYSGASPVPNNGDWIQLTLPHPITLTGLFVAGFPTRIPTAGNVLGSNDNFNSYTLIGSFGYQTTPQSTVTVPISTSIPYTSYRLVVSRVGNDNILSISTFYLLGCDASPTNSPTLAPTYSPSKAPTAVPSSSTPSSSPSTSPTSLSTALIPAFELPTCPIGWTLHCSCLWTDKRDHAYQGSSPVVMDSSLSWDAYYNNFSVGSAVVGALINMVVIAALFGCTRYMKIFSQRSEYARIVDLE